MIVIAAMIKAAEGKGDDLEKAFSNLVPKVLKDPGTIAYVINRGIRDPNKFFIYEKYEDEDALKHHGSTEHFKEFNRSVGGARMVDGRPDIGLYKEVA